MAWVSLSLICVGLFSASPVSAAQPLALSLHRDLSNPSLEVRVVVSDAPLLEAVAPDDAGVDLFELENEEETPEEEALIAPILPLQELLLFDPPLFVGWQQPVHHLSLVISAQVLRC